MKKRKLMLLPLFCLLLTGCGQKLVPDQSGQSDTPSGDTTPEKENEAFLTVSEMTMRVDESFTLRVDSVREGDIPSWSQVGDAVNYVVSADKISALVTAVKVGRATIHVLVGEKDLTCELTVEEKPVELVPLPTPVLTVNADGNGITWAAVEGATGYCVIENGREVDLVNGGYLFSRDIGAYTVQVFAFDVNNERGPSERAEFIYQTRYSSIEGFAFNNGVITWTNYSGAKLLIHPGVGNYIEVTGTSYTPTSDGLYTLYAAEGYNATSKIFYIDGSASKESVLIGNPADYPMILEDGTEETNSDLADKYSVYKYTSTWEASSASMSLDTGTNKHYTENACVKIQYWKHSANFKFERRNMSFGTYNTVSLNLKGTADANEKFKIQFMIYNDTYLAGQNLRGLYMTYTIANPSQSWAHYTISMDDPGWSISLAGTTLSPSDALSYLKMAGLTVTSFGDLLPYFDTYSILTFCMADANWSTSYFYFDDLMLSNTDKQTSVEPMLVLSDNYAFRSDALSGKLNKSGNDWVLSFTYNNNPVQLPVSVTLEGGKLHMVSETTGYDFDVLMNSEDGGKSFTLHRATGTAAPMLSNLTAGAYSIVESFDSYMDHTSAQAAFYPDYYNGGSGTSVIGGNGWDHMTSTDYVLTYASGHTGRAATIKYNSGNAMRYTTMNLVNGGSEGHESASSFSFWAKGPSTRAQTKIKVRLFAVDKVTPSNHVDNSVSVVQEFVIPQGADWTECIIDLSNAKFSVFYGVSFTIEHSQGSISKDGDRYITIDDIDFYNRVSPF